MRDELFDELVASVKEGGAILQGKAAPSRAFEVEPPRIKEIREAYDLSQVEFSALLGISVDTLQNWEQGRRTPPVPAKGSVAGGRQAPRSRLGRRQAPANCVSGYAWHLQGRREPSISRTLSSKHRGGVPAALLWVLRCSFRAPPFPSLF